MTLYNLYSTNFLTICAWAVTTRDRLGLCKHFWNNNHHQFAQMSEKSFFYSLGRKHCNAGYIGSSRTRQTQQILRRYQVYFSENTLWPYYMYRQEHMKGSKYSPYKRVVVWPCHARSYYVCKNPTSQVAYNQQWKQCTCIVQAHGYLPIAIHGHVNPRSLLVRK